MLLLSATPIIYYSAEPAGVQLSSCNESLTHKQTRTEKPNPKTFATTALFTRSLWFAC